VTEACDIVVIGAGAAGLMAALVAATTGAQVAVLEKGARLGGTAAVSGGVVWAPCNDHMGGTDSREAALDYFRSLDHGDLRDETLTAFVETAAAAVRFLEEHSPVSFTQLAGYPDYFGNRPGAVVTGGRALDSGLFPFSELGAWRDKVVTATVYPLTLAETSLGGGSGVLDPELLRERVSRDARGFGQALIGGLLDACLKAGVNIRLEHAALRLEREGERVVGVTARTAEGEAMITARSVIVATGGFEWSPELAQAFLRGPIAYPASPPSNTGDGLRLLMAAGASLANMTNAWWCPTIVTGERWEDGSPRSQPVLIERTLPGSIIVNGAGRRFCNEAVNYSAIAGAFHAFDPNSFAYPNQPAWLIFDHHYKLRWPVGGHPPGEALPTWMTAAATLAEMADTLGMPSEVFQNTVARFNQGARAGYDRFYGDRSRPGALATLGPLEHAPFYAVPLYLGVLGTNGGARTDGSGRVLDHDGAAIPGLFAAGNVIACPTGGIYAGAGGTLGPALTFAYLAGRAAAAANHQGD
jgi:3-oxosteroid 1-dehydrogenase